MDNSRGVLFVRGTGRVKAEDTVPIVLGLPTGIPNMKTAFDRAIKCAPGAVALTDAVVYQKLLSFLLFGEMGYEVEGTPLIDKGKKADASE